LLYLAALLLIAIGIAHSYLGERYILIRLFRRDNLPKILGSTEFTKNTLRFAWHITTLAWFGIAAILLYFAKVQPMPRAIGLIIGTTFIIHGVIALAGSRGRHLSWPVFFIIGLASLYGAGA